MTYTYYNRYRNKGVILMGSNNGNKTNTKMNYMLIIESLKDSLNEFRRCGHDTGSNGQMSVFARQLNDMIEYLQNRASDPEVVEPSCLITDMKTWYDSVAAKCALSNYQPEEADPELKKMKQAELLRSEIAAQKKTSKTKSSGVGITYLGEDIPDYQTLKSLSRISLYGLASTFGVPYEGRSDAVIRNELRRMREIKLKRKSK